MLKIMKRVIAIVLVFLLCSLPVFTANAQASRYRLPTQYDASQGSVPSFRGGSQTPSRVPSSGFGSGMQIPSNASLGENGTTGGTSVGEAAMVGTGYQVHILGEVSRPGTYRIFASERLSEILQRAGGLAENGSERNIELRRRGSVQHVDLLSFTLFGRLEDNPYLTDNDVVFVPLRSKVIEIDGAVKRPNTYELKGEKTLADAIDLAGGFNAATAISESIRVIRFSDGNKTVDEVPIDKGNLTDFLVRSGDVIVVPNLITKDTSFDYNVASIPGDRVFYPSYEDRVFVLGGVAFPGAYPFSPYYMLNQYISLAGGLNDRGTSKYRVIAIDGRTHKAKPYEHVNPGDTIMVKEHWMSPASWAAFALSIASFGLSASSTIIALKR